MFKDQTDYTPQGEKVWAVVRGAKTIKLRLTYAEALQLAQRTKAPRWSSDALSAECRRMSRMRGASHDLRGCLLTRSPRRAASAEASGSLPLDATSARTQTGSQTRCVEPDTRCVYIRLARRKARSHSQSIPIPQ